MKSKILSIAVLLSMVFFTGVIDTVEVSAADQVNVEQAAIVDALNLDVITDYQEPDYQYEHVSVSHYRPDFVSDINYQVIDLRPQSHFYATLSEGYKAYMPRSDIGNRSYLG